MDFKKRDYYQSTDFVLPHFFNLVNTKSVTTNYQLSESDDLKGVMKIHFASGQESLS